MSSLRGAQGVAAFVNPLKKQQWVKEQSQAGSHQTSPRLKAGESNSVWNCLGLKWRSKNLLTLPDSVK